MDADLSLQERYGPQTICFGCGPANEVGLHVRSFPVGDECVLEWQPQPRHQAFENVLNGGVIGTLFDCHSNWTAAYHLMQARGADKPPATVTADFHVRLLKPTPTDRSVTVRARVVELTDNRAIVEAELTANGHVTARCRATFVAIGPGHPAYDRW